MPAADGSAPPAEAVPPAAPKDPTLWQRFLMFLRGFLAWLLEIIDAQLAS